jgi:hypothetical protein
MTFTEFPWATHIGRAWAISRISLRWAARAKEGFIFLTQFFNSKHGKTSWKNELNFTLLWLGEKIGDIFYRVNIYLRYNELI